MSNSNDLGGGLFDFNGDGKTSIDEEFLTYKIFEETAKEENDTIDNNDNIETEDNFIPIYRSTPKAIPVITPIPKTQPNVTVPETLSKENYRKLLSEDELSAVYKKKSKFGLITSCIVGVFIVGFITISVVNASRLSNIYDKAVALVDNGSYKEAIELFEEIEEKNYHDTAAYISLCEAHIDYNRGNISSAYYDMNKVRFSYLSSKQEKTVNDFLATLETEYDVYLKEKSKADAKAYRDRITNGVPYVGMSESEIYNTSLGSPSGNIRHNYECISGKQYLANLYDYKSGNNTIFTARCVQGRVTEVWDYRSEPIVPYTPKKNTKPKTNYDPYDVNDYSNEEDFYYDHYDDFFDYYDAEDYYNEHHE